MIGETLCKKSLYTIISIWLLVSDATDKTLCKKSLYAIIGILCRLINKTLYKTLLYAAKRISVIELALGRYLE